MMFRLNLIIAFVVVMAASSWVTLQALNYLDGSSAGPEAVITVVEATYGMNCREYRVAPPHENRVRTGNATKIVATACNDKNGRCKYGVDVTLLGDPATGCGKDFQVKWRCGPDGGSTNEAKLSPEAHGRSLEIACPAT
jgi:hypothetical protein